MKGLYEIRLLCSIAGISRSGYYRWIGSFQRVTKREKRRDDLLYLLTEGYNKHKGIYGYRRMCLWLQKEHGVVANHKLIYKLLKASGLQAMIRRKRWPWYQKKTPEAVYKPDLLKRDFRALEPNQKWVTDVTYVYEGNKRYFLAAIKDLFDRRIVDYSISSRNDMDLALGLFKRCAEVAGLNGGILHSDQGSCYSSRYYQMTVEASGMLCSMSRRGNCLDNSPMECFFSHLKAEIKCIRSPGIGLLDSIRQYINYYNFSRIQEGLEGLSPMEYLERFKSKGVHFSGA